jgi:hypothetical protein
MEEIRPTFKAVAVEMQNFIYSELDLITESEWFVELVEKRVTKLIEDEKLLKTSLLKTPFLKTPLRVDVNYVVHRLEEIVNSDHTDAEEFLKELKENLNNHEGKKNG